MIIACRVSTSLTPSSEAWRWPQLQPWHKMRQQGLSRCRYASRQRLPIFWTEESATKGSNSPVTRVAHRERSAGHSSLRFWREGWTVEEDLWRTCCWTAGPPLLSDADVRALSIFRRLSTRGGTCGGNISISHDSAEPQQDLGQTRGRESACSVDHVTISTTTRIRLLWERCCYSGEEGVFCQEQDKAIFCLPANNTERGRNRPSGALVSDLSNT